MPISGRFGFGVYFIWVVTNCWDATPACPIFVYRAVFSALLQQGHFLQPRNAAKCSKPMKKNHLPSKSPEIIPAMCQLNQQSITFLLRRLTGVQEAENPRGGWIWFSFWAVGTVHTDISDYCTYYRWHVQNLRAPSFHQQNGNIWSDTFPVVPFLCVQLKNTSNCLCFSSRIPSAALRCCPEMLWMFGFFFSLEVSTARLDRAWSHLI